MDMIISFLTGVSRPLWRKFIPKKFGNTQFLKRILYFSPLFSEIASFSKISFSKKISWHSCVNLKVVFRIKNRLSLKFTFKNKLLKEMHSLLCYKFQRSSCNAANYGKTKLHFKVLVSEHMGVSVRTCKNIKSTKNSAVRDHMLVCDNICVFWRLFCFG